MRNNNSNESRYSNIALNALSQFFLLSILCLALINTSQAAVPIVTGTYKVTSAKYLTPALATCAAVAITVKITTQCGRLLKGTITIAGTTIPVTGNLSANNTILLNGNITIPNYQYIVFAGQYRASPKSILVDISGSAGSYGSITVNVNTFPEDAKFNDFVMPVVP